jgi:hypothetical protein
MPLRKIAAVLALASGAVYGQAGQAPLDDATIGKLLKAGVGEQTVVAMIQQQPGKYALSSDDILALKKAGASDKILAAMVERAGAQPAAARASVAPVAAALSDATPIRLRLTRDLTFTNVKPGEMVDFEILDDLRVDGLLVIAHGARVSSSISQAEPKTRMGRGGKLGVNLDSVPLLNGEKVAVRVKKEGHAGGGTEAPGGAADAAAIVKPAEPRLLFAYGKGETFPEGTEITVFIDGDVKVDSARFLVDMAFTSTPPGALVSLYGTPVGRTPFTTRLAPGTYKAVFSAEGYAPVTQSIAVGPGHPNTVQAAIEMK